MVVAACMLQAVKCSWGKITNESSSNNGQGGSQYSPSPATAVVPGMIMTNMQAMPGIMGAQNMMPGLVAPSAVVLPNHLQPGAGGMMQAQYMSPNQVRVLQPCGFGPDIDV